MVQPRIIGRYAVFDQIAAGGMATVHLGRLLGKAGFTRTVAIKRLHPQYAQDADFVAMFLDEARLASRIRHPNVIPTLDVIYEDDELLLVMEYVQGESLSRLMKATRPSPVPLPIAISVMIDVLHGLHSAHDAKSEKGDYLEIVHRDVSPQNVLLGTDGAARVLDFGVAKAAHRAQTTREGQLKGKLTYMAPEQLRRDHVDRRTDVYSASVVFWEMITGERLFEAKSEAHTVMKILDERVRPPSEVIHGLPRELDAIVARGLERDPAARFQSAREMAVALENCRVNAAAASTVGEWVEALASMQLDARAARIAEIESRTDLVAPTIDPPPTSSQRKLAETASTDPDQPTSAGYASIRSLPQKPNRTWSVAPIVLAVLLLAIAPVGYFGYRAMKTPPAPTPVTATAAPIQTTAAPPPVVEPPPPPTTQAPTATASTHPEEKPAVPVAKPAAPRPAATAATAAPKPKCNPPYTVDAQGIRHMKPECL